MNDSNCDVREVGALKVVIDRTLCVGFGDCVEASPGAFDLDDTNVAIFLSPEHVDRDQLVQACAVCPVDAITVLDENGTQIVP